METIQHDTVDLEYLEVALAETFSKPGTADVTPADRAKLAGLLKHYRGMTHPFRACKRDQMKHGLSEDHANRRCAVIKDLIEGNTKWREGGHKTSHLSEEERESFALDADEEFFTWLSETDADEMIREAEEQQEKVGIVHRLARFLGLDIEESAGLTKGDQITRFDGPVTFSRPDEGAHEEDSSDAREDAKAEEVRSATEGRLHAASIEQAQGASEGRVGNKVSAHVALAYQLPYDFAEPQKISRRLWRKHLLPLGKKINYKGTVLDFSEPTLKRMVDSAKRRAFDAVYVTVGHTRDADKGRGVLKDLFIKQEGDPETDGLYGDFELSEEGEKVIRDNLGAIGTSVSYHPNYTREADGEKFGPAIQHVAFTPTPHVPGLKPWEAVQMSEEELEVVDLTDAEYAAPDPVPRKESGPMETQTNEETREVEMEGQQVDLEAKLSALESALNEERTKREAVELAARRANDSLREQGINAMLDRMVAEGKTTPPKADAAKPIFAQLAAVQSDVIELSTDGAASVKDDEVGKAMLELLAPGVVPEVGERGTNNLEADDDPEEQIHRRMLAIRREKGVSADEAFDLALEEVGE